MLRVLVRLVVVAVLLAAAFAVLSYTGLLVPVAADRSSSMAPSIPVCDGRALAEGFTYKFRDPRRGETVAIHASSAPGGRVTPDPDARDLVLMKRVVGVPGDQVLVRAGSVFVNGVKIDDITTEPFPKAELLGDQYFVLDDNRSFAKDSRDFGPVLRDAIFGRVFLVFWPLRDIGSPESRRPGPPPGQVRCD